MGLLAAMFFGIRQYPAYRIYFIAGFTVGATILSFFYKWLENGWDKYVITKMARAGKIALVNIEKGEPYLPLRDSGFRRYWIYRFEGTLYNRERKPRPVSFFEKMNVETREIPQGSVYVTWDETKPAQIFIVPNALIGSLPQLAPLVGAYEKDKALKLKYLDAHYHRGMILRSFRQAVADYRKAEKK
ncbi:MAG: hypothetical protein LBR93_00880 [Treponema sp.]|jgi:hypothetical protein|nr:hypothetical protein [Treponema sp.]